MVLNDCDKLGENHPVWIEELKKISQTGCLYPSTRPGASSSTILCNREPAARSSDFSLVSTRRFGGYFFK